VSKHLLDDIDKVLKAYLGSKPKLEIIDLDETTLNKIRNDSNKGFLKN